MNLKFLKTTYVKALMKNVICSVEKLIENETIYL